MDLAIRHPAYSADTVEKEIREFFLAERKHRKLTQEQVADVGGLEQSTISKIERDAPYEPSVAVFMKAICGLGMTPSQFFAKFEQRLTSGTKLREELQKTGLKSPPASPDNPPVRSLFPKAAHHGGRSVLAEPVSEDDLRGFFRTLQEMLGSSVFEAIQQRQHQQEPAPPDRKGARPRKAARNIR